MYNVFFDDTDLNLSTKIKTFIEEDKYGYYIDLFIRKSDVVKCMCEDIIPIHLQNGKFIIRVRLNNSTNISLNGIRIDYLGDERLKALPLEKLKLREMILKRYFSKRKNPAGYCYATKAIFKIEIEPSRRVIND